MSCDSCHVVHDGKRKVVHLSIASLITAWVNNCYLCIIIYMYCTCTTTSACTMNKYRLFNEVKVSMGFIIPRDEVMRLINGIETIPR